MKFNKISKKLAACSLAGAMMASMMGMSVCAAGVAAGTQDGPIIFIPVNKTVTAADNTYAPKTTFTFSVTPAEATAITDENGASVDVKAGIRDGLKADKGAIFAPDTTADTSTTYAPSDTNKASLKTDAAKFTEPGIYHYVVSEVDDGYEGITYDPTVYDVYVYVSAKLDAEKNATSEMYVSGVVSTKSVKDESGESKITKSDLDFTNVYNGVHSVTVTKKVQGGFANVSDTFKFDVTVNGAADESYKVVYTTNSITTTAHVTSGGKIEVTLGKDDTVTIYGLSETDSYTIAEQGVADGKTSTGYTVTDDCGTAADGKVEGAGGTQNASYTITNTKAAAAPTGIAMTVAPYILMVAVAGIFALLFLRRRHEEA